jgi:hypothetical protein
MSALVTALYADHATADRVRVRLSSGDNAIPTDRVQLTSATEPGHAGLVPASSYALKLRGYFHTLFDRDDEMGHVGSLSDAVQNGQATVAVFPRGDIETQYVLKVLREAKPLQLLEHDLDKQALEHAASSDKAPLVEHVVNAVTSDEYRRK